MADKMKKTVEEVKAEVEAAAAEVLEQVEPAVEKAKKAAEKAVKETKQTAGRAARATKKTAEKAVGATKQTAKRAVRKAAGELTPVVYVQYQGDEEKVEDLVAAATAAFKSEHLRTRITDLRLYIKPEERAAYYVVNERFAGRVDF